MRDGIRRFQRAHDLPATGVADNETVKSLGLDPDQIFRKAAVKD
jgi:murein L,D-transpeptidase YcbB/YkuD